MKQASHVLRSGSILLLLLHVAAYGGLARVRDSVRESRPPRRNRRGTIAGRSHRCRPGRTSSTTAAVPEPTKWGYDLGSDGWGNNELQHYTDRIDNASVGDGVLTITARKEPMNGRSYTSARLVSKNKGDFRYGRVEVRARLPSGRGTWPAI